MATIDLAPSSLPEPEGKKRVPTVLPRWAVLGLMGVLLLFIGVQSYTLWEEWRELNHELTGARHTTVVGYLNISPNPSYAAVPNTWVVEEGDQTLLWAGWRHGQGHQWFKVARGEVTGEGLSKPIGRDVIQAIDWPVVEVGGGQRWSKIPWDAPVVGVVLEGVPTVYPLLLLKKVEVINDQIDRKPVLVLCAPFVPDEQATKLYDPVVDGKRLTMGLSGYFHHRRPVLYDRGTESLWVAGEQALVAIAGPLKGLELKQLMSLSPTHWSEWRTEHPQSRLIVGADRSKALPTQ